MTGSLNRQTDVYAGCSSSQKFCEVKYRKYVVTLSLGLATLGNVCDALHSQSSSAASLRLSARCPWHSLPRTWPGPWPGLRVAGTSNHWNFATIKRLMLVVGPSGALPGVLVKHSSLYLRVIFNYVTVTSHNKITVLDLQNPPREFYNITVWLQNCTSISAINKNPLNIMVIFIFNVHKVRTSNPF